MVSYVSSQTDHEKRRVEPRDRKTEIKVARQQMSGCKSGQLSVFRPVLIFRRRRIRLRRDKKRAYVKQTISSR